MRGLLRRLYCAGIGLVCLSVTGCLQVPYCLPELNYAKSVDAKCERADVYVFRVDITQKLEIRQGKKGPLGEVVDYEELTQIQPSSDGKTSLQVGMSLASGWRYVGFWNHDTTRTGHAIALRFYRPGFATIIVPPGESPGELTWNKAEDLIDQVKALDDLMSLAPVKTSKSKAVLRHALESGRKSTAHRQALLFGAGEYERLAREVSADADERELHADLLDKAKRLRALTNGDQDREP